MYRALRVLAGCGVVLVAGCSDSSPISADLQNDLALASAGADLQLASLPTSETRVVGAVERTTPPSKAVARSTRAPRPRRSPRPQVAADVQQENEIVQEPEVAAVEEPMPTPAPVEEAPVEVAASTRPRAIEPAAGGAGPSDRGTDWGTLIGIAGTVVLRGGGVGEDRCIPPSTRPRTPIAINQRFPQPRGRGTGRIAMGGGRTTGRPQMRTAPTRPRDVGSTRPMNSGSMRAMPSGNVASSTAREPRAANAGDLQ